MTYAINILRKWLYVSSYLFKKISILQGEDEEDMLNPVY